MSEALIAPCAERLLKCTRTPLANKHALSSSTRQNKPNNLPNFSRVTPLTPLLPLNDSTLWARKLEATRRMDPRSTSSHSDVLIPGGRRQETNIQEELDKSQWAPWGDGEWNDQAVTPTTPVLRERLNLEGGDWKLRHKKNLTQPNRYRGEIQQ